MAGWANATSQKMGKSVVTISTNHQTQKLLKYLIYTNKVFKFSVRIKNNYLFNISGNFYLSLPRKLLALGAPSLMINTSLVFQLIYEFYQSWMKDI